MTGIGRLMGIATTVLVVATLTAGSDDDAGRRLSSKYVVCADILGVSTIEVSTEVGCDEAHQVARRWA